MDPLVQCLKIGHRRLGGDVVAILIGWNAINLVGAGVIIAKGARGIEKGDPVALSGLKERIDQRSLGIKIVPIVRASLKVTGDLILKAS